MTTLLTLPRGTPISARARINNAAPHTAYIYTHNWHIHIYARVVYIHLLHLGIFCCIIIPYERGGGLLLCDEASASHFPLTSHLNNGWTGRETMCPGCSPARFRFTKVDGVSCCGHRPFLCVIAAAPKYPMCSHSLGRWTHPGYVVKC